LALALLVTLFFAVRLVVHAVYWSQHRDAELADWMTIGYVAQSYDIERDNLARAVGLEPGSCRHPTIAEIARRTGRSVSPAPGFLETSQTAYLRPMEVLRWVTMSAEEPRARRPRISERSRLRSGSGA
jgi:hypothetical protein